MPTLEVDWAAIAREGGILAVLAVGAVIGGIVWLARRLPAGPAEDHVEVIEKRIAALEAGLVEERHQREKRWEVHDEVHRNLDRRLDETRKR